MALLLGGCVKNGPRPPRPPPPLPAHMYGSVHNYAYTSSDRGFTVPYPVTVEKIHGRIQTDGPHNVTFADDWGSHISFAEQAMTENSPMMAVLAAQGREKALGEFAKRAYGDLVTVHYHPEVREGAVSFIYVRPALPITGVAAFVQGRRLFLVETDLLPGLNILSQGGEKSQSDQEAQLEARALALAQTIIVK